MSVSIVPSLPASSFDELHALVDTLSPIMSEFQVDIVDGVFVSSRSWPFTEGGMTSLDRLSELPSNVALELDCMVKNPSQYFTAFTDASVTRVVVHFGSTEHLSRTIAHAHAFGFAVGLGFTNDVPLETVKEFIDEVEYVQVMGIQEVGKQGQPFDERTLDTIRTLRAAYPSLEIAVDGSVNTETIPALVGAGATRLCPGSAIAKALDPVDAYEHLTRLATI